ncbi:MAG: RNA methyltransferase [Clostridia bacterium]|nr:RNA methyltransferase [Clostridia bacterium]
MISLPEKYKNRMETLLGDEFGNYLSALSEKPVRALRVNTDKISTEKFIQICPFPIERIPYVENGFYFEYDGIGNHPFHHAGMFYIQEPGAMAPAECIDIETDWKILDMCAAPGGKSTQLKNKLGEKGLLVSNEIIPSRCRILTGNIERLGLKNTVTTCMDTKKLARSFPHSFDLIMVDAPCSGEGMFRKEEIAISEWSEENVKMCAIRSREILENAVDCLKGDGYIIYATCTFSLEENEMLIDSFLSDHPEFELLEVSKRVVESTSDGIFFEGCSTPEINRCRRFYPHKSRGEGQFMALLHCTCVHAEGSRKKQETKKEKTDPTVTSFLEDVLCGYDSQSLHTYNFHPVLFSGDMHIKDGLAFSCGVTVGEVKKSYLQPHHQFFMAMGQNFRRKIDLSPDGKEIKKYLRGEEFETDCENGWAVVTVCGCTLGGVKVVSGRAKNHYPKGLRIKGGQ